MRPIESYFIIAFKLEWCALAAIGALLQNNFSLLTFAMRTSAATLNESNLNAFVVGVAMSRAIGPRTSLKLHKGSVCSKFCLWLSSVWCETHLTFCHPKYLHLFWHAAPLPLFEQIHRSSLPFTQWQKLVEQSFLIFSECFQFPSIVFEPNETDTFSIILPRMPPWRHLSATPYQELFAVVSLPPRTTAMIIILYRCHLYSLKIKGLCSLNTTIVH